METRIARFYRGDAHDKTERSASILVATLLLRQEFCRVAERCVMMSGFLAWLVLGLDLRTVSGWGQLAVQRPFPVGLDVPQYKVRLS
jgi:hypothetical protein